MSSSSRSHTDTRVETIKDGLYAWTNERGEMAQDDARKALAALLADLQRLEAEYEVLLGSQKHWRELAERNAADLQRLEEALRRIADPQRSDDFSRPAIVREVLAALHGEKPQP